MAIHAGKKEFYERIHRIERGEEDPKEKKQGDKKQGVISDNKLRDRREERTDNGR